MAKTKKVKRPKLSKVDKCPMYYIESGEFDAVRFSKLVKYHEKIEEDCFAIHLGGAIFTFALGNDGPGHIQASMHGATDNETVSIYDGSDYVALGSIVLQKLFNYQKNFK